MGTARVDSSVFGSSGHLGISGLGDLGLQAILGVVG